MVKVVNSKFECQDCGQTSLIPMLSDFQYGEALLRSETPQWVYLNMFADKTYEELHGIIKNNFDDIFTKNNDFNSGNKIFDEICCDPDEFGKKYTDNFRPPNCLYCHSVNGLVSDYSGPNFKRIREIPDCTHVFWNDLSEDEKIAAVGNAIKEILG